MVFQKPNPFPKSIFDNVAAGLYIRGIRSKAVIRERVETALRQAALWDEVKDRLHTSAYGLSGGQQQRLCIARTLAPNPEMILLDEPTSALDPLGRREVRDVIKTLKDEGVTVFLNSHLLGEVESVCDRVAIIDRGRIVRLGALDDLLRESLALDLTLGPYDDATLRLIEEYGAIEAREADRLRVRLDDLGDVPRLVAALVHAGVAIYGVTPHRRSLEDVFIGSVEGGTE
jgi:ABC-type multidrug transport system ATPase subunit